MSGRSKRADVNWRKSSYSSASDCIEVAIASGAVLLRDSKNRNGPILNIHTSAWHVVLSMVKMTAGDSRSTGTFS